MSGFWALEIIPGKEYHQVVDESFHMSMAALAHDLADKSGRTSVEVTIDGQDKFVLCTLTPGKTEQQLLDLEFTEGEDISFKVLGKNTICLTGNYMPEEMPYGDDMSDDEDEDEMDGEYALASDEDEEINSDELPSSDEEEDMSDMSEEEMVTGRITEITDDDASAKTAKNSNGMTEEEMKDAASIIKAEQQVEDDDEEEDDSELDEEELAALAAMEGDSDEEEGDSDDDDDIEDVDMTPEEEAEMNKQVEEIAKKVEAARQKMIAEKQQKKPAAAAAPAKEDKKRPNEAAAKSAEPAKKQQKTQEQQPKKAVEEKKAVDEKKRTLPSGLVIEEKVNGTGSRAKNGKRVSVRYVGRLTNGKVFDENTKGKPFSFKLGAGEVIKGWDLGVQGMQVGGHRRLTVPAKLAYGAKGAAPDIPGNATLVFDVKLLEVK